MLGHIVGSHPPHVITLAWFIKLIFNLFQHSSPDLCTVYFLSTALQGERQTEREGEVSKRERERKKPLFSSLIGALCDKIQSQALHVHNPPSPTNTLTHRKGLATKVSH